MMPAMTRPEHGRDPGATTGISALAPLEGTTTVEAEISVRTATVQLLHFRFPEPIMGLLRDEDAYLLDMCLIPRPRNARARYCEYWGPRRFERLGSVFVLPPGQLMQVGSDGGLTAGIVCRLRPDAVRAWLGTDIEWTPERLDATLDVGAPSLRGLLLRLAQEVRSPGFAGRMLIELLAGQIAIELGRYCAAIMEAPAVAGLAPWRLRMIDERLEEIGTPPTLAELASLCRLSVRQISRGFRVSRGCSIGDYVAASRIGHAKRLLATEQSIKSIAYSLGFSSPSGFCCAFRRAVGQTPGQFRQWVPRMRSVQPRLLRSSIAVAEHDRA